MSHPVGGFRGSAASGALRERPRAFPTPPELFGARSAAGWASRRVRGAGRWARVGGGGAEAKIRTKVRGGARGCCLLLTTAPAWALYLSTAPFLGKRGLFVFANDLLPSQCGRLSPPAALPAGSRRVLRKVRVGTRCRRRVTGGRNGLRRLHSESTARRGARELTFRCVSREQADRTRPQKIQRGQRGDRHEQQEDSADLLAGPS